MTALENPIGLFAEPDRVRVFGAVALGAASPEEVARLAGTSSRDTATALRRFADHEVILQGPDGLTINHEHLRALARQETSPQPTESPEYADDRVKTVLRTFIHNGRLLRLPAQWTRKKIVLDHIASTAFTSGVWYTEAEVNTILRAWCDGGAVDHVTIRRYLVDLLLLRRDNGTYWLDLDNSPT